ncbi:MAG: ThuA domain-containing protein, partial [Phycisphaeraceae bacterium]|nr:ThuA domain-containing protein [Phycisphaeraceae bacterium]
QNNHNWRAMTPVNKATLEATGRFVVSVSTLPSNKAKADAWDAWKPEFSKYDVVVSNYNDGGKCRWPEARKKEFVDFVSGGGGFVPIHAADNSSGDWPEYNKMIAVGGWGGRKAKTHGSLLRKVDGTWKPDPAPRGRSGSHGRKWAFPIIIEKQHPITEGMPKTWKHAKDELYNSLRGPCENVQVLASAHSKQSRVLEPMAMLITYGKGKVFHIPLGHVGSTDSIKCVGFQTLLARGTEFVATGKVTIGIPEKFPTADEVSIVEPAKVQWPALKQAAAEAPKPVVFDAKKFHRLMRQGQVCPHCQKKKGVDLGLASTTQEASR